MSTTIVDVRGVAPKDRLERVLGAWDALVAGGGMELFVDHDPRCMYYTLRALYGEDAFTYECLADGPEDWHARVVRVRLTERGPVT